METNTNGVKKVQYTRTRTYLLTTCVQRVRYLDYTNIGTT